MNPFAHFAGRKRTAASLDDQDGDVEMYEGRQEVIMEPFDFKNPRFVQYLSTLSPAVQTHRAQLYFKILANRLLFSYQQRPQHLQQLPSLGGEVDFLRQNILGAQNALINHQQNHDAIVLSAFALINNTRFMPIECINSTPTFYTYPVKDEKLPTLEVRMEGHKTRVSLYVHLFIGHGRTGRLISHLEIPKGTEDEQCAIMLRTLFKIIENDYFHQTHMQRHFLGSLRATAENLADCVLVPRALKELKENKSLRVIPPIAAIIAEYATPYTFDQEQARKMKNRKPVCKVLSNTQYFDQVAQRNRAGTNKKRSKS